MIQTANTLPALPPENATAVELLKWGMLEFGERLGICTSFQMGGMVLLDMAVRLGVGKVPVFTVDTQRLPEETHELIARTRDYYGVEIEVVYPDAAEVSDMAARHGEDLFRDAVAKRKLCREVRKVRPLQRKLATLDAWVVGLRREQGDSRESIQKVEWDLDNGGIYKLSPLSNWSDDDILDYVGRNGVPVHPLYEQGYTSIECAPCTRATFDGEHFRAGRWWWEQDADKECGIHFSPGGEVRREVDVLLQYVLQTQAAGA
jgi:phosphoadenosine phosphosulfate reductase